MAWEFNVLVVANVTATSEELLAALGERAHRGTCRFTLLMPRDGSPDTDARLQQALEAWRAAGLGNASGRTGDTDPIVATMEAWDPLRFDEIVVSTLPTGSSRWMGIDLPRRLAKLTSVPVQHVVSRPPPELHWERPPEHERYGVLSPLAAALTRRTP